MTAAPVPVLRGERVRLRLWRMDDVDALFALYSDPRFMRYWSFEAFNDRAQAESYLARNLRDLKTSEFYPWALTLDDDVPIGNCTLFRVDRQHRRCELGYGLAPSLQGQGLALEATKLAIDYAFNELDLHRIEADIDPRNAGSCRLVERLGFQREGLLRERWRVNGEITDTAFYGLLSSDQRP